MCSNKINTYIINIFKANPQNEQKYIQSLCEECMEIIRAHIQTHSLEVILPLYGWLNLDLFTGLCPIEKIPDFVLFVRLCFGHPLPPLPPVSIPILCCTIFIIAQFNLSHIVFYQKFECEIQTCHDEFDERIWSICTNIKRTMK